VTVTRLTGGLTPGDGSDPRTFPAIFNAAADVIDAQGSAIAELEDLNPVQFGTAIASDGQVLAFSTALSGYEPADVFGSAVNGTAVYRYVDTVYFTSSGTFTKATYPWLRAIRVKCVGGGGGGGGNPATGAGQASVAGGGGGGGYAEAFITDIAGLSSSVSITVGAGGSGGGASDNAAGTNGGDSSFGSVILGGGGSAGQGGSPSTGSGQRSGGAGGSGTGDFVVAGGRGFPGDYDIGQIFQRGYGGQSHLAPAATTAANSRNVSNGVIYGGGGSGSHLRASSAALAGGNGADGIVIVELYA
jgi:hypothetical protein